MPASPDLRRGSVHRPGPPGGMAGGHTDPTCRVAQGSVHTGITQRISLLSGFRDWGAQVKFTGIIWASISWQSGRTQW